MLLTHSYRIKDSHTRTALKRHARAVNAVWNYCNAMQRHHVKHNMAWPRKFDFSNACAGSSKLLDLHSQTVQAICEEYAKSRKAAKKAHLRFRGKESLGWIPVKASGLMLDGDALFYQKKRYRFWKHRDLPDDAVIKTASFSQDADGRWYFNVTFETAESTALPASGEIGLDLGLKTHATGSNGFEHKAARFYRDLENRIGKAQRAGKKRFARALQRKAKLRRRDANHKASRTLVENNGLIVVGDVSPARLKMTRMAKSVSDQGWSDFRNMLRYKAIARGAVFLEVKETHTTRTCSACLARCGPKGLKGLGIREWTCDACGTVHDRDINAARNILRLGHETLAGGSPVL